MHDDKAAPPSSRAPEAADRRTSPEFREPSEHQLLHLGSGPLLLIAALGLLFFAKLVFHPSWVLYTDHSDLLTYQIPQMRYLVSSWQQTGEQPLWCPYSFAGMPFLHDLQVGAFYPPHLVLYYLPEAMVGPALSWLVVAHVIIAGWTMYIYARSQGLNRTCATVAACCYMFSGKWLLHLLVAGQYVMVGLAWLPLVLLLLERSVGRGGFLSATWAGGALALVVLGSHPQLTFYAGLLIVVWSLPTALEQAGVLEPRGATGRNIGVALGRWSGALAWSGLVALALASIQLLPTLEAATQTTRGASGMRSNLLAEFLFSMWGLIGPPPAGLPSTMGWEYRTGWTALCVATAVLAPGLVRGKVRFQLQAFACLLLIIFGLGAAVLLQSLPGFRLFRIPSRMFLIVSLPMALLIGKATQALSDALPLNPGLGRTVLRLLAVTVLLGLASIFSLVLARGSLKNAHLLAYWGSLLLLLPVVIWLTYRATSAVWRSSPWTGQRFQIAWGALLLADLWAMGWPLVAVRPQTPIYAPPACVRLLMERRNSHERVLDREVPGQWELTPFEFGLPILEQLEQVRGYNPLDIHRYKEFVQFISDRDGTLTPGNGIGNFSLVNKTLLDLLGTRYLVQPTDFPRMEGELEEVGRDARWRVIGEDPAPEIHLFVSGSQRHLPPFTVYENLEAFPRAFVVHGAEALPERSRVLTALKQSDLRRVVFLEGFDSGTGNPVPPGPFQPATIASYQPNHVVVDVESDAPGYLVLTDPWYPGWTSTLDDQPARLYRANYTFRAVAVPAGKHRVRFDFEPISYQHGRMISTASLAAILGLGLMSILRRGRRWPAGWRPSNRVEPEQTGSEMSE